MIGDIIKIKGIELLVLDEYDGNPFVIALNTEIETAFDNTSNNYDGSILESVIKDWLKESGIPTIARELDLMTLDGCKDYGKKIVDAAPLTLREYQDYYDIILPHINEYFWLATGWSIRPYRYNDANDVCVVYGNGTVNRHPNHFSVGLIPAFVLNQTKLGLVSSDSLKGIPTEVLVAELNRRFNK